MSTSDLTPAGDAPKPSVIKVRGDAIMDAHRFVRFKGQCMVLVSEPYEHYVPLTKSRFETLAYGLHGGLSRSQVSDDYAYVENIAEEQDEYAHYISFGMSLPDAVLHPELNDGNIEFSAENKQCVWDSRRLEWVIGEDPELVIWRSPYPRLKAQFEDDAEPIPFIMSLAGGDKGLYDDIMQSLAPIIMDKKPDGVIWFVGEGANGKSTLMDAIYRLFPGQLASVNVKSLEDGRDTPKLNRALANIVRESSEGRVEDTERYKCLGTHEEFWVHKFHSQEGLKINGNIHTIFNANTIPAFNDKGHSARRRTFIIPFRQTFESDPEFEHKTFTAEFFSRLVAEMTKYAQRLRDQHYHYKFSVITNGVKEEYDREAGTADEYIREMVQNYGLIAFDNYRPLKQDYDDWCAESGYVPLGQRLLRKAAIAAGFEYVSLRRTGVDKVWRIRTATPDMDLVQMNARHGSNIFTKVLGLYTTPGFENAASSVIVSDPEPIIPDEPPKRSSILNHKW